MPKRHSSGSMWKSKQWIPYVDLPRRKKRDAFIKLRWRLKQEESFSGEMFTGRINLDVRDPGRSSPEFYQNATVKFLGSDGLTVWHCLMQTCAYALECAVDKMASEQWQAVFSEEDGARYVAQRLTRSEMFIPVMRKGKKYYQMRERGPDPVFASLGNLSVRDYLKQTEESILEKNPPAIYESMTVKRDYHPGNGMGLEVTVDAVEITCEVVESVIRHFREVGETSWRAQEPISDSELLRCAQFVREKNKRWG